MTWDDFYSEYALKEKKEKVEKFKILNQFAKKGETLLIGSSLMEGFPIHEFLQNGGVSKIIYNRAIGGYTTTELIAVMETCIYDLQPTKIFINIGSNDIACEDYTLEALLNNYSYILNEIQRKLPDTKIYVMAYYPVNEKDNFHGKSDKSWFIQRNNTNLLKANKAIKKLALEKGCKYIDLNTGLYNEEQQLKKELTIEGLHMYANGYKIVFDELLPYILE